MTSQKMPRRFYSWTIFFKGILDFDFFLINFLSIRGIDFIVFLVFFLLKVFIFIITPFLIINPPSFQVH